MPSDAIAKIQEYVGLGSDFPLRTVSRHFRQFELNETLVEIAADIREYCPATQRQFLDSAFGIFVPLDDNGRPVENYGECPWTVVQNFKLIKTRIHRLGVYPHTHSKANVTSGIVSEGFAGKLKIKRNK